MLSERTRSPLLLRKSHGAQGHLTEKEKAVMVVINEEEPVQYSVKFSFPAIIYRFSYRAFPHCALSAPLPAYPFPPQSRSHLVMCLHLCAVVACMV